MLFSVHVLCEGHCGRLTGIELDRIDCEISLILWLVTFEINRMMIASLVTNIPEIRCLALQCGIIRMNWSPFLIGLS